MTRPWLDSSVFTGTDLNIRNITYYSSRGRFSTVIALVVIKMHKSKGEQRGLVEETALAILSMPGLIGVMCLGLHRCVECKLT